KTLYQLGRAPGYWFISLGLDKARPAPVDPRLWAEAQWLYAQILFDLNDFERSLKLYDLALDEMKGRALFHQERAWAHLFVGNFVNALGSIVAAESKLVWKVPFFDKYFIRSWVEPETCNLNSALKTVLAGRAALQYATPNP